MAWSVPQARYVLRRPCGNAKGLGVNNVTLRGEMRRGFSAVTRRLDMVNERVRHGGVLLEALRDDIRQLAEAHVLLDGRVERYRQENDAAHHEILALLRTSYRDLDRRVSRFEAPGGEGATQS